MLNYNRHHSTHNNPSPSPTDVADEWSSFQVAVLDASGNSPSLPREKEADWITEEVRNPSRKKKEAWLHLRNTLSSDSDQHSAAMAEYCRFVKLTKVAAEKARNACWNAGAEEAAKKAKLFQQLGCGGSLIKELKLLKKQVSTSLTLSVRTSKFFQVTSFNTGWSTLVMCPNITAATSLYREHFQMTQIYPCLRRENP